MVELLQLASLYLCDQRSMTFGSDLRGAAEMAEDSEDLGPTLPPDSTSLLKGSKGGNYKEEAEPIMPRALAL